MNPDTEPFFEYFRSLSPYLSFQSDQEYRQHLRRVFRFSPEKRTYYANIKSSDLAPDFEEMDIDPISKDEMDLDMDALEEGMDMIFLATCDDPIFRTLYEYAAGRMFSTDLKIGQAVLCSYDTFPWYFSCVWQHLVNLREKESESESESQEKNIDNLTEYRKLCNWFSIRSDSV